MKKHPLAAIFGSGEGSTIFYFKVVAHNMYLELLMSQGIVGLVLVAGYIIMGLKNLRRIDPYCAIAFVCMIVMSATLSEFTSRPVMLAFFLAGISVVDTSATDMRAVDVWVKKQEIHL